jgi:SAM-dependent methyltransferase
MEQSMRSSEGAYWDQRYRNEGAIWGDGPSPTARLAQRHLAATARILEVGFGYGRDLLLLAAQGHRVSGVECSREGHRRARSRLEDKGIGAEDLCLGRFEDCAFPDGRFDLLLCHRMLHLLETDEAVGQFAARAARVLAPAGLLCLGTRHVDDLNPQDMSWVAEGVYEYKHRPGHRIRYWHDGMFEEVFGSAFAILSTVRAVEPETTANPVPCQLVLMVARKKTT